MLCIQCEQKPIRYKQAQLCYGCWRSAHSLANLDTLEVYPCEGGCGRRIHNLPKIIISGIPQGHGAGKKWCSTCADNRPMEPKNRDKGPCIRCDRPMRTGRKMPGFMKFHGKGLCASCYNYSNYGQAVNSYRKRVGDENKRPTALNVQKVAEIKKRLLAGETQKSLAQEFSVHKSTIYHINAGHAWGYVDAAV